MRNDLMHYHMVIVVKIVPLAVNVLIAGHKTAVFVDIIPVTAVIVPACFPDRQCYISGNLRIVETDADMIDLSGLQLF